MPPTDPGTPRSSGEDDPASAAAGDLPASRPTSSEGPEEQFQAAAAAAVGRSPRRYGVWVAIGVVAAVLAVTVGLYVVESYLPGLRSPIRAPSTTQSELLDLCNLSRGTNCMGNAVDLPSETGAGFSNTSSCDAIPLVGAQEQLWMNFTNNGPSALEGVVLPAPLYSSGQPSWYLSPWELINDSPEIHRATWHESIAPSVEESYTVAILSAPSSWCLGWWAPGGASQLVWTSDLSLTYISST